MGAAVKPEYPGHPFAPDIANPLASCHLDPSGIPVVNGPHLMTVVEVEKGRFKQTPKDRWWRGWDPS